jgi:hypothetical protein
LTISAEKTSLHALAVVLLLAIIPIMLISIRRFRSQEETR